MNARLATGPGLAIESATSHVEVAVWDAEGRNVAAIDEDVQLHHTRRLTPLVAEVMKRAGLAAESLDWIAVDLGPGSFTGVRVGLATAHALSMLGGRLVGASSLTSLALGSQSRSALVVPLVPAGRRDLYYGLYRVDRRGSVHLVGAPGVATVAEMIPPVEEALAVSGAKAVRVVGPGVQRERDALARAWPGCSEPAWRNERLSALDLAEAALCARGPAAGLPVPGATPAPLYVRSAQAEERVRRQVTRQEPTPLRPIRDSDLPDIAAIERQVFSDPWPESFFREELKQPWVYARVAERGGVLAGYSVAWLGAGTGHLGNLAVIPSARRRGVASVLIDDLLARAAEQSVSRLTLEVRASNFAAQALYRAHGFRLAGLRRGYYRDTAEDALILEWRATDAVARVEDPETKSCRG